MRFRKYRLDIIGSWYSLSSPFLNVSDNLLSLFSFSLYFMRDLSFRRRRARKGTSCKYNIGHMTDLFLFTRKVISDLAEVLKGITERLS